MMGLTFKFLNDPRINVIHIIIYLLYNVATTTGYQYSNHDYNSYC